MNQPVVPDAVQEVRTPDPRVLAHRIADRRLQLGLSESALATQAGMAPRYLQHLLAAGVDFDPAGLRRIAWVLQLTYDELLGGRTDLPPGQSGPSEHPALFRLTTPECWDRIGIRGVGRVAVAADPAPTVFPVNYAVDHHSIVYRTAPGEATAPDSGSPVSFEIDHLDDRAGRGWSVLVTGTAERIDDPVSVRRLHERHSAEPWAGGDRDLWIRILPEMVGGRRIGSL
ncbi:pyridoxamine 5'-phosphate oxidase family protein [Streptomyces sp. V4-01]|uniref:Pyridoxamine 5'-phosphate oxidase family protein n=1 Tax=Actinacidiphila polyblastidii TaxID=3110430 RepID=A0ABU7PDG7_9ACTN|nr:pyridoxamine 5'-phosphate oxidase family protein [Streptomyces sp. V4-01]